MRALLWFAPAVLVRIDALLIAIYVCAYLALTVRKKTRSFIVGASGGVGRHARPCRLSALLLWAMVAEHLLLEGYRLATIRTTRSRAGAYCLVGGQPGSSVCDGFGKYAGVQTLASVVAWPFCFVRRLPGLCGWRCLAAQPFPDSNHYRVVRLVRAGHTTATHALRRTQIAVFRKKLACGTDAVACLRDKRAPLGPLLIFVTSANDVRKRHEPQILAGG